MGSKLLNVNHTEKKQMTKEAKKAATRALDRLQQSEREIQASNGQGLVPTWTGKRGAAGSGAFQRFGRVSRADGPQPSERPLFGSHKAAGFQQQGIGFRSSASLLEQLKARNAQPLTSRQRGDQQLSMARDLITFIKSGNKSTKDICRNFESRLVTETDQYVFRNLLQKLCKKRSGAQVVWVLREEFAAM